MVDILDQHVGEIVSKVKKMGLENNTLIIFTSDNGPHREGGADPGYFKSSGPFRGYKRSLKDGGIRVPMIASWKGKIVPGGSSDHLSSFQDVKSTIADILKIAERKADDGISFYPTLVQKGGQQQHEFLYWEFGEGGEKIGVRYGKWKAIKSNLRANPDTPFQLYDLEYSTMETRNVADDNPEIIQKMEEIVKQEHVLNKDFLLTIDEVEEK
jgi:arylsulfatase A-like enzyme